MIDGPVLLLRCPAWSHPTGPDPDVVVHAVAERPGRDELDPLLRPSTRPAPGRIAVAGTDADLAAVAARLMRTEMLGTVALAYLPADPDSGVADTWALPTDPARAWSLARRGEPDRVPLVRDDSGGVLLGRGEIRPMRGVVWCDDQLVLRGPAARLLVTPAVGVGAGVGVDVRVIAGWFGRRQRRAAVGRAVQIGCAPARVVRDGVAVDRPVTRWTWYRHTEDLRLVRGPG